MLNVVIILLLNKMKIGERFVVNVLKKNLLKYLALNAVNYLIEKLKINGEQSV